MSQVPTGVKVIAILNFIGSAGALLIGLALLVGGASFSVLSGQFDSLAGVGSLIFILMGTVFLGFGILGIVIGLGLYKRKQWARVLAIIFSFIALCGGIFDLIEGNYFFAILSFIIHSLIGGYLIFSRKVQLAFSRK